MIYLADCREYMKTLEDKSIDCIITDPPYDGHVEMNELHRICRGNIVMFCSPENQFFRPDEYLFWIKTPSTKNYSRHPGRFVEMILVLRGETYNQLHWSQMTGVYDDRLITPPVHPNQKPLALIERLVRIYSNPGDLIFDPYAGSGTTLRAAMNLGCRALGCEIDPAYYRLAQEALL